MKLQKSNKYKGKIALGLATLMLSGIVMSGCNSTNAVVAEEPVATVEVTSTPTPTLEPTPIPELSYEEEIELLGMIDSEEITPLQSVHVFEYVKDGQRKMMFAFINAQPNEEGYHDVYECFTRQKILTLNYSIYDPNLRVGDRTDCVNITIQSEKLKDVTIERGYMIFYLPERCTTLQIPIINNEYYRVIYPLNINEILKTKCTVAEVADMYLSIIPKEYRVSANDLFVNQDKALVK